MNENIDNLRQSIDLLFPYLVDDQAADHLIARDEWGAVNFKASKRVLKNALDTIRELDGLPIEFLTTPIAGSLAGQIRRVDSVLKEMSSFRIEEGDALNRRDDIANRLRSYVENLIEQVTTCLPYLAYKQGTLSKSTNELNRTIAASRNLVKTTEDWAKNQKLEVDKVVAAIREASAEAGVARFTDEFDRESKILTTRSYWWLGATAVFAVSLVLAAIFLHDWPSLPDDADGWMTIRITISKISLIAVLFTGAIWCGRIYRALVHQATINKHRALSLKTFQAFVKATDDPRIQDAVLMAATKTVFGSVPTGLVEQRTADQDGGVQFVEIGRNVTEKVVESAAD